MWPYHLAMAVPIAVVKGGSWVIKRIPGSSQAGREGAVARKRHDDASRAGQGRGRLPRGRGKPPTGEPAASPMPLLAGASRPGYWPLSHGATGLRMQHRKLTRPTARGLILMGLGVDSAVCPSEVAKTRTQIVAPVKCSEGAESATKQYISYDKRPSYDC